MGDVATVADLARIFQTLKVSPTDIIAILQALREQGALKARIKIQ
jgi:flagellar P-ring protein precursor FlgI